MRTRPSPAVVALVAANAVPLLGVLFWGWVTFDLMLLYWFENGVIGVATALKMLGVEVPADGGSRASAWFGKLFMVGFFALHYGMFWWVHGIFVVVLFGGRGTGLGTFDGAVLVGPVGLAAQFLTGGLLVSVLALVASHGVSFVANVVLRGEDRQTPLQLVMARPYGRVAILHVTLIFGGFVIMALGEPIVALLLFVVLKTSVDLGAHRRAHRTRPTVRVPGGLT